MERYWLIIIFALDVVTSYSRKMLLFLGMIVNIHYVMFIALDAEKSLPAHRNHQKELG